MRWEIIKKKDFITTKWPGGQTTQLAIYPEDAIFSEKDFLWRISSATFTSTESKFSDFTGYQRYILPISGKLSLYHERLYNRDLGKYDVDYFDGSWTTSSRNTLDCRDYNFIVKNGSLGKMQILKSGDEYTIKRSQVVTVFSMDDFLIGLDKTKEEVVLEGSSLLVLETDDEENIIKVSAKSPIIITEFVLK